MLLLLLYICYISVLYLHCQLFFIVITIIIIILVVVVVIILYQIDNSFWYPVLVEVCKF